MGLSVLVPAIFLFVSLTYVFFTILLFVKEQVMKMLHTQYIPQIGAVRIKGVSAVTYILSCFLMITKFEALILYDGIFIAIYIASIRGNLVSLWLISKGTHI